MDVYWTAPRTSSMNMFCSINTLNLASEDRTTNICPGLLQTKHLECVLLVVFIFNDTDGGLVSVFVPFD
jgi:hypothetical protein